MAGVVQAIPSEAEVLLPAGIALKVTSVLSKDASGLTIVTLEDDEEVTRPRCLLHRLRSWAFCGDFALAWC